MKLTVEVGGHPIGKVGNGKEISAEIDALRPCGATAGKTRTRFQRVCVKLRTDPYKNSRDFPCCFSFPALRKGGKDSFIRS